MSNFATPAFVLRTFPHKEGDLIVRFFTMEFGRLAGVARGARKARSSFTGRLEVLHLSELRGFRAPGRELAVVDAIASMETFPRLRASLEGFYRLHYVAELLDLSFDEEQPHPEFFALVQGILTFMDLEAVPPDLGLRYLELKLLAELGYGLAFDGCLACGESSSPFRAFELAEGGFLCEKCCASRPEAQALPRGLADCLRRLSAASLGQLSESQTPQPLQRALRQFCQRMLVFRLEKPLRSARYLDELDSGP